MRDYELLYIIKADITEEQTAATIEKFNGILTKEGAEITGVDEWGKRKLAYEIDKKYREGYYVLVKFSGPSTAVDEADRLLKIDENVLRHMITKACEK